MTLAAVREVQELARRMRRPDPGRHLAFMTVPALIDHYGAGAAALAVDAYDEKRAAAGVPGRFSARPFVTELDDKMRRKIAWATEPLYQQDRFQEALERELASRLSTVVSAGVAGAGRNTTTGNLKRDRATVGWRRVTGGHGCPFCRMLAARGAVYRKDITARFAAHDHCDCTAEAVFRGEVIEEADVFQYSMAEKRSKSPEERRKLTEYLNRNWSDENADLYD